MPIQNMTQMLKDARDGGYAVGAFNVVDYTSMRAVVDAAVECTAPVIVQTSVKTVKLWGEAAMISWFRTIAADAPVPVAIHLDHCRDVAFVGRCIDAGWTSVMFDGSQLPYDENLAATRSCVERAHAAGASVEAELGRIVGVEDDIAVPGDEAHLADPDEAVAFCEGLGLDCFAPAIGTAHGVYKGEPRIAYDRLEEIATRTGLPLALHGGTGLSDEVFAKCIALGCAKVNISTQLKHAFIDAFLEHTNTHTDEYNPLKQLAAQHERIAAEMGAKIELFGSAGRARARDGEAVGATGGAYPVRRTEGR